MSATRRSREPGVCTAIRPSFPSPPDRSGGAVRVDELEDVEDEPQDHVDFGGDAEFESEIEDIVVLWNPWKKAIRLKFLR